jgi:hypothetical protein
MLNAWTIGELSKLKQQEVFKETEKYRLVHQKSLDRGKMNYIKVFNLITLFFYLFYGIYSDIARQKEVYTEVRKRIGQVINHLKQRTS